jgi:N-carbamoylputrescine amidase
MGKQKIVKVGLVQHACSPDKQTNVDKACAMIRDAAGKGAQIVATPELFASQYFPQVEGEAGFLLAEPLPGPTSTRMCELAKELRIYLTVSLFEKRAPGLFHNTSLMINPKGEVISTYRKMHIPDDPRFFEKYYFTPGDIGWQVQDTEHARTGMLVCWDQWYPEAARLTALRGAQILFYPTAIGWYHGETPEDAAQQREAWRIIQRSHAIANGVFVVAINRIGVEGDLKFWGSSFVADPGGSILIEAGQDEEAVLIAECDLSRMDAIRQGWPFLRDRRIDAYGEITKRYID